MPVKNLAGQRFGRLTAIRIAVRARRTVWDCECECGNAKRVIASSLLNGNTRSCGCLMLHGHAHRGKQSPEYRTWCAMKNRCERPLAENWERYGGRGIKIEFASFEEFFAHVGPKPTSQHSIDRIDVNGNYRIGNVRWATRSEQNANQRRYLE